jgi:hypothetical protein
MSYSRHNPYLGNPPLGEDQGDVGMIAPVILLLGLVAIGGALVFFKNKGNDDYYYDDDEPAVERVRNVIDDIEDDEEDHEEDEE